MALLTRAEKEPLRACRPHRSGHADSGGVKVFYEVFGDGPKTIVFVPPWAIVRSRIWKTQVPFFARTHRVVTYDARGSGESDKAPRLDYSDDAYAADLLAVLDELELPSAIVVSLSCGARYAALVAARKPERVEKLVFIAPAYPLAAAIPERAAAAEQFEAVLDSHDRWHKMNRHYWRDNYRDFVEFFFAECFCEPHSTKQIEDAVGWGLETTHETLASTVAAWSMSPEEAAAVAAQIRCPTLVIHGDDDRIIPYARGEALARATGGKLLTIAGAGHCPQARDPVAVNLAIRDFIEPPHPVRWTRGRNRRKRALFISSPIGLGHAQRDVAIADAVRALHPDLEIEWLAQHPVTTVLEGHKERIHPASRLLSNESSHFEHECGEHDLHAFQALRRMDETLVANFMVFHDVVRESDYDLVVGDEAWDVDNFLHENPELKRTQFAWLTDFVGFLP
ncbi:MAG: alpha/beta hydrolase, partial [Candidatus Eremiobacteraeota bacterium]|nr:alpha/beta hydrolase [Candidatus Eremiobacteraeota bacterium]